MLTGEREKIIWNFDNVQLHANRKNILIAIPSLEVLMVTAANKFISQLSTLLLTNLYRPTIPIRLAVYSRYPNPVSVSNPNVQKILVKGERTPRFRPSLQNIPPYSEVTGTSRRLRLAGV
jgi:hypothetical protein